MIWRVSSLLIFGLVGATLRADTAYMTTGNDQFGTIDLGTGVFTILGTTNLLGTSLLMSGLGTAGGVLYGGQESTSTLFSINTSNGNLTTIGTGSINYFDFGSTLTGLYGLDSSLNLYSVNRLTGGTTLVGSTGLTSNGTIGLSTNSSTLYFTDAANIYTLNTTTGAATLLGTNAGTSIGALVFENGVLYAGQDSPTFKVDTINTGTGAATGGATLTGTSSNFWGLAPNPLPAGSSVPEPSSIGLVGLGFGALAACRRIRYAR